MSLQRCSLVHESAKSPILFAVYGFQFSSVLFLIAWVRGSDRTCWLGVIFVFYFVFETFEKNTNLIFSELLLCLSLLRWLCVQWMSKNIRLARKSAQPFHLFFLETMLSFVFLKSWHLSHVDTHGDFSWYFISNVICEKTDYEILQWEFKV